MRVFFFFIHIFSFLIWIFVFLSCVRPLARSFSVAFFGSFSHFCCLLVQYFLDGWLQPSSVLKLSCVSVSFNDSSRYCSILVKKVWNIHKQHCHYQPEANSTKTIYLLLAWLLFSRSRFCSCTDRISFVVWAVAQFFFHIRFLPVTFGDIVFFGIHYILIKSHHDAVEYNGNDNVEDEHRQSDNIFRCGLFMGNELILDLKTKVLRARQWVLLYPENRMHT